MNSLKIGLESSSIMPLVAITPLTQDCYQTILDNYSDHILLAHEDSIIELKNIFRFKADTFYSNPLKRLEKIKELPYHPGLSLKGGAMKLLLDGQAGGWMGNKNSRVQALFFSDVIDSVSDTIDDPADFCNEVIMKMKGKIETYRNLLTPLRQVLSIQSANILPYWGYHNISTKLLFESNTINVTILPDCESIDDFEHLPSSSRRDTYHYHMLRKEKVNIILVGDANYEKNICRCLHCANYSCKIITLKDRERKALLNLN